MSDVANRGEAVSRLRHELRTPVNVIIGYCELVLEDTDPKNVRVVAPLTEVIASGRQALHDIDSALHDGEPAGDEAMESLARSLRDVRHSIDASVGALLASPEILADTGAREDVRKVREAAARLASAADGVIARRESNSVGTGDGTPSDTTGAAHVLVVDDAEENRELLARRLRKDGYRVTLAATGAEALERAAAGSFDAVLLDVMMPDMDGIAVLERLKAAKDTADVPVIMISALDDVGHVVSCIERGAEDYLPKPFNPVLLRARLRASLEKKRHRDAESVYLRQVDLLTQAAAGVEGGHVDLAGMSQVAARGDGLGQLARVFISMIAGVERREARLRERISELSAAVGATAADSADPTRAAAAARDGGALRDGDLFAGRYEVQSMLGAGGMGVVYRVRDRELAEVIALKLLRPDATADDVARSRFRSEIRLARRISHGNVVRTHDLGEADGLVFVTMELVEGVTLRRMLDERGKLAESLVVAIGAQLARALSSAHETGVIHRDIKPQNLILDRNGTLKVMDFGIARLSSAATTLTQAGTVVGTPAYMSPEQLLGEQVDERSDLYSVGVVLYECATGRLPFEALSPVSLIARMLSAEAPAISSVASHLKPAFAALVTRLIARDPKARPQSALELANALESLD